MFNDDNEIKGVCCIDCGAIIANGDESAITDDWDGNRKMMLLISQLNYHIVVGDKTDEFSTARCDVCLTTLAGSRYDVSMWELPD